MKMPALSATILIGGAILSTSAIGQPSSKRICAAALEYLSQSHSAIQDGMLLASSNNLSNWVSGGQPVYGSLSQAQQPQILLPNGTDSVNLAYFMTKFFPTSGAVSAKVSVLTTSNYRTNYVDLHRSRIAAGSDRCERRGRASLRRRVRVNEYIDYHDPRGGGLSSDLEDFHFNYPVGAAQCAGTNDPATINTFLFEGVKPTQGDTFISRNFPVFGTAYAVEHNFSMLRSELYYRANVDQAGTCVGFFVPLNGSQRARFVINEYGFGYGGVNGPKGWLIGH